jgi:hypothetical protein
MNRQSFFLRNIPSHEEPRSGGIRPPCEWNACDMLSNRTSPSCGRIGVRPSLISNSTIR